MECLEGRSLLSTAISGVAWATGGVTHRASYAIDKNDQVEVSVNGSSFTNLGGYTKQVSAGLDIFNKSEVYAIAPTSSVSVKNGSGWVSLGGYARQISATVENTVYGIGILVKGFAYLDLNGSAHGTTRLVPTPPDVGTILATPGHRAGQPAGLGAPVRHAPWHRVHQRGAGRGHNHALQCQGDHHAGPVRAHRACLHRAAGGDLPIHHRAGQGHRRLRERRRLRIGEGHARG